MSEALLMSKRRNFICPATEAPCERRECKKGALCAIQKEEDSRPANERLWGSPPNTTPQPPLVRTLSYTSQPIPAPIF
jgi:hypothetical protein